MFCKHDSSKNKQVLVKKSPKVIKLYDLEVGYRGLPMLPTFPFPPFPILFKYFLQLGTKKVNIILGLKYNHQILCQL